MKKIYLKRITTCLVVLTLLLQFASVTANAEEETELTGKTAKEITLMMEKGWNLGNTFDATGGSKSDVYSQEISWGNPQVVKELIDGVAAAGYKTIRIPVTWNKHCDKRNGYTINPDFMARIKEVVTWAYEDGLFIIINCHHESWINRSDIDTAYEEIGAQLTAVWSQIADEFADFDQHLIFEGMNEPRAVDTSHEWSGNSKCYKAVNYLNQLFVETVRANGKGHNGERMLMIPGYAASSSTTVLRSIEIPKINGEEAENIAVSVHCYSPYNFCLSDNQTTFSASKNSDTSEIKTLFSNIKTLFTDKGIPVVIGECGCTNSQNNLEARVAWFTYFGNMSAAASVPAIVWDNGASGSSGGECHKYFLRRTGELVNPELTEAFLMGTYGAASTVVEETIIDFEPFEENGSTTIAAPSDYGFTYAKLGSEMNVNHTSDAKLGFSMKVEESTPDFTAKLDVSDYAGNTINVSAWVYSKAGASVSVGVCGSKEQEMASLTAASEWTEVTFSVELPAEGESYIYFKGADNKFNVDDIHISTVPASNENGDELSNSGSTGVLLVNNGSQSTGLTVAILVIVLVFAVTALIFAVTLLISRKRRK